MTAKIGVSALCVALGMLLSCAHDSKKDPNHSGDDVSSSADSEPSEASESTSASSSATSGDSCAEQACSSNEECCKGYVCGFDPERSRAQRYCLAK